MNEHLKAELQELTKLASEGALEDVMKPRLEELRSFAEIEERAEKTQKERDTALAQKEHFRSKYEKEEADKKALEAKMNSGEPQAPTAAQIDSIDLIKLGKSLQTYSDEELDFVTDYAKSKKPEDILKALENPFVQSGISSYREKVEKDRLALKPNPTQPEGDTPVSLEEALKTATPQEKEQYLRDAGLYNDSPGYRADKVDIGRKR